MNEEEQAACEELARYRGQLIEEAASACRARFDPFSELRKLSSELLKRPRIAQQPAGAPPPPDRVERLRRKEKPLRGYYSEHPLWRHLRYGALDTLGNADDPQRGELLCALEMICAEVYERSYFAFRELFEKNAHSLREIYGDCLEELAALERALPLAAGVIEEDEEVFYAVAPWPLRPLVEGSWWSNRYRWSEELRAAAVELLTAEKKLAALGYGAGKESAPGEVF